MGGQPKLPQWQVEKAKCEASINGKKYPAIITRELDYGRFKVTIAITDTLNNKTIIQEYPKPVSSSHLKRRSSHVTALDGKQEEIA